MPSALPLRPANSASARAVRWARIVQSPWTLLAVALPGVAWCFDVPLLAEDYGHLERAHRLAAETTPWQGLVWHFTARELFYRPIHSLVTAAAHAVFGIDPHGLHATSVVLWLVTLFTFRALAHRLLPERTAAAAATLLLALSPGVAENVGWFCGLDTLLPVLCTLTTLWLAVSALRRSRSATTLCGTVALFCKEWAVLVVPVTVVVARATLQAPGGWRPRLARAARWAWPLLVLTAAFLVLRAFVIGRWVGGYGMAGLDLLDLIRQRVVHVAAVLFPVPSRLVGRTESWIAAGVVAAVLVLGVRTAQPAARRWGALAIAWIVAVNVAHVPVLVDRVNLHDSRYFFPAVPAVCLLAGAALTGAHRVLRAIVFAAFTALWGLALIDVARDWIAAGRATASLRAQLVLVLGEHADAALEVSGVAGAVGSAHFGYGAECMTRVPFVPAELAGRTRFLPEGPVARNGTPGPLSFLALWHAATAPPADHVERLHWSHRQRVLLPALRDDGEVELRGRVVAATPGHRLECTAVAVDAGSSALPAGVALLHGRVAASGAEAGVLAVATALPVPPSVTVHALDGGALRVRVLAAPGTRVLLLIGRARRPVVLGDLGVLLVDAPAFVGPSTVGASGEVAVDLTPPDPAAVRAQVVLLARDGTLTMSECACLPR